MVLLLKYNYIVLLCYTNTHKHTMITFHSPPTHRKIAEFACLNVKSQVFLNNSCMTPRTHYTRQIEDIVMMTKEGPSQIVRLMTTGHGNLM